MTDKRRIAAAIKAIPPGTRGSVAPQSSGMGRISPVQSEMYYQNPYKSSYGPFMPRQPQVFSDGAFSPMPPIQVVPVDQPPPGGTFPDPRYWQYTPGWNLPTPPGTEGLKLASFEQLKVLSERYSVARACIDLRQEEIRGLTWEITMTKDAAKAYQGSHSMMKDFGKRAAEATKFFRRPDKGYWNFDSFMNAVLEEIFVYDALCLIFRPKYGAKFGMGGKGLLGSDLDTIRLVPGPTIRPLVDLHGDPPMPPNPAYQQFLYGVPRSDYQAIMYGDDLAAYGMEEEDHVAEYRSDMMLYAPYWARRESPYGFPPVERALLPIISGLQKQEYQLDYFKEGSVPAVYISPGDPNITPTQIRELQDALNGIAGDPAFHLKVVVLPPGSKVDPQRPIDLSDSFDQLVMEQVCMAFDVQPMEIGIIPDIGGGQQGPSASAIRFAAQETRDIKSRKSTKPLLKFICDIFNMVLQDICGQTDMRFQFEGLADDEDKQAITELGVQQVQNGIASIDEVRDRLDLAPWGLQETSEPVVFTAQGPIPFSMAPELIRMAQQNAAGGGSGSSSSKDKPGNRAQSTNSGQRSSNSGSPKTKQPSVRQGGQTKPNGSHKAPVAPHRESLTPGHSASAGAIQSPTPRTGGSPSRSSVAGSRKKAVMSELDALKRHLRKDRTAIFTWEPRHIDTIMLAKIADDLNNGVLIDVAVERAAYLIKEDYVEGPIPVEPLADTVSLEPRTWKYIIGENLPKVYATGVDERVFKKQGEQWPGWEHDLGLVGAYKQLVATAFKTADAKADGIRKDAASGKMYVDRVTLRGLIAEEVHDTFLDVLIPLWSEAWHLGYESAKSLVTGETPDFTVKHESEALDNFINAEGMHWVDQIARTGLIRADARAEVIARTEVARAMNAAAIQAYRDNAVTHKHLLLAPDDVCDICKSARKEGIIPLDAIFPSGGLGGPLHPQCRCVPAPAGINVEPPQAHIGKNEDRSLVAFLLYRSMAGGKEVFLLQKRAGDMKNPGTWGMPGGTSHTGEDPWACAWREAVEEMGDLPAGMPTVHFMQAEDHRTVHIFVIDVPEPFIPGMDGSTQFETAGFGWFNRKEIKKLNLQPNFREQWDSIKWDEVAKFIADTESGEMLEGRDEEQVLFPAGARWPYRHRGDGAEAPDDLSEGTHTRVYGPDGDETTEMPRKRTRSRRPGKRPSQEPPTTVGRGPEAGQQPSGLLDAGVPVGVAPSGKFSHRKAGPRPVVGSVPAETPKPATYGTEAPEPYDPAESVATETDQGIAYYPQPRKKDKGGPADYTDPNPVDSEHVYVQMAKNFPPAAITWVRRAHWIGPVNIPWDRIDDDDVDSWAASHQPGKVKEFEQLIRQHKGHVAPSVLVQEPNSNRAFIVDGHHRALARKNLGQPVLAYVGNINPNDRQAALETHTKQMHQGSDPRNK